MTFEPASDDQVFDRLRQEYYLSRYQMVPKRAKGADFNKAWGPWFLLLFLFLMPTMCYSIEVLKMDRTLFKYVFALILLGLVSLLQRFISAKYLLPRALRKQYPLVYKTIDKIVDAGILEKCDTTFPALEIDGKVLFLVNYYTQIEAYLPRNLTGFVLVDKDGAVIQSTDLFQKAFLVTALFRLCTVDMQSYDYGMKDKISIIRRYNLRFPPRFLAWRKWSFETEGMVDLYNQIAPDLRILDEVITELNGYRNHRAVIQEKLGYAYGNRFYLEDARVLQELIDSFSAYMKAAYVPRLLALNFGLDAFLVGMRREPFWQFLWLSRRSVASLQTAVSYLLHMIDGECHVTTPEPYEWQAYVDRLKYVRKLGIQIMEIGDFCEEFPHSAGVSHGG
jgi:hypothetical protein